MGSKIYVRIITWKKSIKQQNFSYRYRPLSAAEYIQFEKTGSLNESFKFCRHELPIRLINILEESNALPLSFVPEKIQEIKDKYSATLDALLPFINAEINDENIEKFGFTFFVKDTY